jgi:carbon starvation protein
VNSFGPEFSLSAQRMSELAREVKEESLYGRTGGAATLAVGMANLFSRVVGEKWLGIWYHFALMFEALFILTTLDAGTRVGRYLLQDALGRVWKPLGEVRSLPANVLTSGLVVALWGYFLIKAVYDPDGGIKALWPIFGIANQLLAATALCLATTIILKMTLRDEAKAKPKLALVTLVPLLWLLAVTGTAAVQKIWDHDPKIGFLAGAQAEQEKLLAMVAEAKTTGDLAKRDTFLERYPALQKKSDRQVFNLKLDAFVTGFFLALVVAIFLLSVREWILLLARKKAAEPRETPPTWLPDYAVAEAQPLKVLALLALTAALLRELSGEAAVDRAQHCPSICARDAQVDLLGGGLKQSALSRSEAYRAAADRRFQGPNRCC